MPLSQEQMQELARRIGANLNMSPEQINQLIGSVLGGTSKTVQRVSANQPQASASFSAQDFINFVSQLAQAFGVPQQQQKISQEIEDLNRRREDIIRAREAAKTVLEQQKALTLSQTREEIEAVRRQTLQRLGLAPAIGSGTLEELDRWNQRAIQTLNTIAAQYDAAIANLDFQTANELYAQQERLINLLNQQLQMQVNLTSGLLQTGLSLYQLPLQVQYLQQQLENQRLANQLTELNNILSLYQGRSVDFKKLPKDTQNRLKQLSQSTGIPLDAISFALSRTEPSQILQVTDANGVLRKIGFVIGDTIKWVDAPSVPTAPTTAGSSILTPFVTNFIETGEEPRTSKEREEVGRFLQAVKNIPIMNEIWKLREVGNVYIKTLNNPQSIENIAKKYVTSPFVLNNPKFQNWLQQWKKRGITNYAEKQIFLSDLIFMNIAYTFYGASRTNEEYKNKFVKLLAQTGFYSEIELKKKNIEELQQLLRGIIYDYAEQIFPPSYLEGQ